MIEINKSYLANLLQNHLFHILRKYEKQEIKGSLDTFLKQLSAQASSDLSPAPAWFQASAPAWFQARG